MTKQTSVACSGARSHRTESKLAINVRNEKVRIFGLIARSGERGGTYSHHFAQHPLRANDANILINTPFDLKLDRLAKIAGILLLVVVGVVGGIYGGGCIVRAPFAQGTQAPRLVNTVAIQSSFSDPLNVVDLREVAASSEREDDK